MPPIDPDADLREVVLESRVPPDRDGTALVDFLSARFRYLGAEDWRRRIADGRVTVDGRHVAADHRLRKGDRVAYRKQHREPPAPTDVAILHDADGIVAVAKPAGLPFHADGAFLYRTLVGVLAARLGPGLRPVQRLDRETSGICVLARERRLAGELQASLAATAKEYDALVRGVVAGDDHAVDAAIGPASASSIGLRRAVVAAGSPGAQSARTDVVVVARSSTATRVRCRIRTGRTHQIRVHLEHLGHPVLGDKLYGRPDAEYLAWVQRVKAGADDAPGADGVPRQMLHAARLVLTHPRTGERLAFDAAPPPDFVAAARSRGLADPGWA